MYYKLAAEVFWNRAPSQNNKRIKWAMELLCWFHCYFGLIYLSSQAVSSLFDFQFFFTLQKHIFLNDFFAAFGILDKISSIFNFAFSSLHMVIFLPFTQLILFTALHFIILNTSSEAFYRESIKTLWFYHATMTYTHSNNVQ